MRCDPLSSTHIPTAVVSSHLVACFRYRVHTATPIVCALLAANVPANSAHSFHFISLINVFCCCSAARSAVCCVCLLYFFLFRINRNKNEKPFRSIEFVYNNLSQHPSSVLLIHFICGCWLPSSSRGVSTDPLHCTFITFPYHFGSDMLVVIF